MRCGSCDPDDFVRVGSGSTDAVPRELILRVALVRVACFSSHRDWSLSSGAAALVERRERTGSFPFAAADAVAALFDVCACRGSRLERSSSLDESASKRSRAEGCREEGGAAAEGAEDDELPYVRTRTGFRLNGLAIASVSTPL